MPAEVRLEPGFTTKLRMQKLLRGSTLQLQVTTQSPAALRAAEPMVCSAELPSQASKAHVSVTPCWITGLR
jgi:hypothetical protein